MLGYCSLGLVIVSTVTFVLGTFPGNTTHLPPSTTQQGRLIKFIIFIGLLSFIKILGKRSKKHSSNLWTDDAML